MVRIGLPAPAAEISHQLLTHTGFDAHKDALEDGFPGGLQRTAGNQPEQRRLTDAHRQPGIAAEAPRRCLEDGFESELEVIDKTQPFQLAIDGPHLQVCGIGFDLQADDRFHLQLEHLEAGDHIAVAARAELGELLGIQQCSQQPFLLLQVMRQPFGMTLDREIKLLTGFEGQRHDHHLTRHDPIESEPVAPMPTRIAFLGPNGTYGEQAAQALIALEQLPAPELVPCVGLRAVVEQLASGGCDAAVVPVENSVEGGVTATLDALWSHRDLCIRRALVLPIRHSLLSHGPLDGITEVLSHPQALAQCSGWLARNLPKALQLPTSSTAEAARMVSGSRFRAAIASRKAGQDNGLEELAHPVNDVAGNRTRFLLLQRGERRSSGDVASLAFSLHRNAPGALLEALASLARQNLNMSRIESRPSKRELGEYVFFVDVELPGDSQAVLDALVSDLTPLCEHLANLGAYPSSEQINDGDGTPRIA